MTATLEELGFKLDAREISNKWEDQKIVLAGPPKCGKTAFLSANGDKTWFLRHEAGFNHVKTFGEDIRDYSDLDKSISRLLAAQKAGLFKWDTLVIDPGGRMMDILGDRTIDLGHQKFPNSDINEIGDIGKGTGWYWYKNLVKTTLGRLDQLPCAQIIVLHVYTEEKSDNPKDKTKTYKREIISLSEKLGGPIREWADHILQVKSGYVGDNMTARSLVIRGSKLLEAGTRSKKLPESISWTSDDTKNWQTFRSYFD